MTGAAMSRWTDEELRELVTLWPTNSAPQIAERLHRQPAAIRRKAMLLGLPAANALHEKHSRRVRRDVEPLVAGLAENVPAHADARFVVETMGVAIRALFGVERDHNAHTIRMILRDIFDQSESNTHIVQPQRATNQKSESQKAMSSRFIVGC